jgi:DNA-directed RNA polymerase specialized sigma24 family protein
MGRTQDRLLHDFVVGRFPELRRAAYLMCGDWKLSEDLVRMTLAKIVAGRRRHARSLDALSRRALMNAFRSDWRGAFRRRERVFSALGETIGGEPAERRHGDPIVKVSVLAALHGLPPQRRAVMVLHHWENLSHQETAKTLKISTRAVRAHSAAGVAVLRSVVGDRVPEFAEAASAGGTR